MANGDRLLWFIDRKQINEYYLNVEDYDNYRFMSFRPRVVGFKIEIPDGIITSNGEGSKRDDNKL